MNYFKTILILFLLMFGMSAHAATLYFDSPLGNIAASETVFPVDIKIDTEGEEINAVDIEIDYSSDVFSIDDLSNGNSILMFWLKNPKIDNGKIIFAGIIPGGFNGKDGQLLRLFIKAKKQDLGFLNISDNSKVLLNDGRGTEIELNFLRYELTITEKSALQGAEIENLIQKDTNPPASFSPQVAREPDVLNGKWFLSFATQDKESGIDYYEILESRFKSYQLKDETWVRTESPYVLKDQTRRSYVFVKAVDKSGNEIIAMILPGEKGVWYADYLIWVIIILVIVIPIFVGQIWHRYKKRIKNKNNSKIKK
jgi:hypothetical protein